LAKNVIGEDRLRRRDEIVRAAEALKPSNLLHNNYRSPYFVFVKV